MFTSNVIKISTISGKIAVTGGEIFYKKMSPLTTNNSAPLVVIHGGPAVPHGYLSILGNLATTRPIIFYDQLGCGLSDKPKDDSLWQVPRFVEELHSLSQALNAPQMHLFGHSWGAAVAQEYALKFPQRVNSLTLASPLICAKKTVADTYRLLNQLPEKTKEIILAAEKKQDFETAEYKEARGIYVKQFLFRGTLPDILLRSLQETNMHIQEVMWGRSIRLLSGVLLNYDRSKELKNLKMPTLITCGSYDFPQPDSLIEYAQGMPNFLVKVFSKSSHMPHLEEEKSYLNELENFLDCVDKKYIDTNTPADSSSPRSKPPK